MPHEDKATDHSSAPNSLLDDLPARYRDAGGWRPKNSYKKQQEKFVKSNPELFCHESLFENRADPPEEDDDFEYGESKTKTRSPNPDLFGTLWRRGELALLCGPTGVGKTILAVQLGEAIARGRRIEPFRAPGSPPYEGGVDAPRRNARGRRGGSLCGQDVLYLDLERTRAQHDERYSVTTPTANGKPGRTRTYKFAGAFHHYGISSGGLAIPEIFRGDLARYYKHSIDLALRECPARIIIIDSLASLDPKRGRSGMPRQLRALKLHAATHNLSILVIVSSSSPPYEGGVDAPKRNARGRRGGSLFPQAEITEIADSVFALSQSTMAEDIRYIKQLKSNSAAPLLPPNQVLTYRLTRNSPPARGGVASASDDEVVGVATENTEPAPKSPPCLGGVPEGRGGSSENFPDSSSGVAAPRGRGGSLEEFLVSTDSRLQTQDSRLLPANPFLGFTFLGFSPEESHLIDYTAEALDRARRVGSPHVTKGALSAKDALIQGMTDGSYQRYLKGE